MGPTSLLREHRHRPRGSGMSCRLPCLSDRTKMAPEQSDRGGCLPLPCLPLPSVPASPRAPTEYQEQPADGQIPGGGSWMGVLKWAWPPGALLSHLQAVVGGATLPALAAVACSLGVPFLQPESPRPPETIFQCSNKGLRAISNISESSREIIHLPMTGLPRLNEMSFLCFLAGIPSARSGCMAYLGLIRNPDWTFHVSLTNKNE